MPVRGNRLRIMGASFLAKSPLKEAERSLPYSVIGFKVSVQGVRFRVYEIRLQKKYAKKMRVKSYAYRDDARFRWYGLMLCLLRDLMSGISTFQVQKELIPMTTNNKPEASTL